MEAVKAPSRMRPVSGFCSLKTESAFTAGWGTRSKNLIWSTYLVNIEDGGTGSALLRQEIRLCQQDLSPLPFGFLSIVPQALTQVLPSSQFAGFIAGRMPGSAYVTEPFMDLWGAENISFDDEMPMSEEDPRVTDQDEDGEPGVTPTGHDARWNADLPGPSRSAHADPIRR